MLASDLRRGEAVALPAALLVLLLVLGVSLAALVPFVVAACTVAATLGVVWLLAHALTLGSFVPLRRGRLDRDRARFLALVSLALHYYRDVIRVQLLGPATELAHADLAREIEADARALPLDAATRRVRILEEIAAAVTSNVTIPYAVGSAQHRMGLAGAPPA